MADTAEKPWIVGPPTTWKLPGAVKLEGGGRLKEVELVYETYGELSPRADNAVLICHALSGHHHAAGHYPDEDRPGWWDALIGPGKALDTDRFFVVSSNNLGGCHGSTGPGSTRPGTDKPWGADFPQVRVADWVRTQAMLADHLGIDSWHAVIGGSLGGMQALEWAITFPERVRRCVAIACAVSLSTQNIAFNAVARKAIELGLGRPADDPERHDGMGLARMLGHLTYLSEQGINSRFGREIAEVADENGNDRFEVEKYLEHLARRFIDSGFNVDTYLKMTHVLDQFDLAERSGGDLVAALAPARCRFLVVSFDSDWRFPPARSRELTRALIQAGKRVSLLEIHSDKGHDSFLFDLPHYCAALKTFLERPTFADG